MLLRCHGIGADSQQIRHQFGGAVIGIPEMLRCAKQFGLKARIGASKWGRLATMPLPAIAVLQDGGFLLLGKATEDKILLQRPLAPRPATMTRAEFEAIWDGRLILATRRASL